VSLDDAAGRSSSGESWIGVDLGTSGVRAAAVSTEGRLLAIVSVDLRSAVIEGNRHETHPEEWWTATLEAISGVTRQIDGLSVRGISVCGTSGTVTLVEETTDDPASPIAPGLMYNDGRASVQAARIRAIRPAESWIRTGFVPGATSGLAKALWLSEELAAGRVRPRRADKVRLAHQVDIINSRLVGEPVAADSSHAMKTGVDLFTIDWPTAVFDQIGLDSALLPPVVRPGETLGGLDARVAQSLGLAPGTPVIAGMSDGCAGQIAAGILTPGEWCAVMGTTTVLKGVSAQLLAHDPLGSLYHHRPPGDLWWPGGASSTGIGAITDMFGTAEIQALSARIDLSTPASIVTYPLRGLGERFPFVEPDATGFSTGIELDRSDLFASYVQGLALALRLCFERVVDLDAVVNSEITLVGGGSRNPYWTQLIANVLGRSVRIPETPEGALGMAVLAASSVSSLDIAAASMVHAGRVIDPDLRVTSRFDEGSAVLRDALRDRGWMDHRPMSALGAEA
jgi:sugar (pentulose or hexulose) kinase